MTAQQKAYLAGLIDGDGSLLIQLRKREGMKYLFRVKTTIIIYQDVKLKAEVEKLWKMIGAGYLYVRNDHIAEIRIEGFTQVERLLSQVYPYLRFKKQQAWYMVQAIQILHKKGGYSLEGFLTVCDYADQISLSNYTSKLRKYSSSYVKAELEKHNLLPVTTGSTFSS